MGERNQTLPGIDRRRLSRRPPDIEGDQEVHVCPSQCD